MGKSSLRGDTGDEYVFVLVCFHTSYKGIGSVIKTHGDCSHFIISNELLPCFPSEIEEKLNEKKFSESFR